jgi:hypothetical protein
MAWVKSIHMLEAPPTPYLMAPDSHEVLEAIIAQGDCHSLCLKVLLSIIAMSIS